MSKYLKIKYMFFAIADLPKKDIKEANVNK